MKKQKSFNKCIDRYTLIEKSDETYTIRGKVFNQTIVISTPNMPYEEIKLINEEIFKNAKIFEDQNKKEPKNFIMWLTTYISEVGKIINVTLSGQPILV